MTATMLPTASSRIGFLDLSAELRNNIYDLALVHPDPIKFQLLNKPSAGSPWSLVCDGKGRFSVRLLRTCQQISNEATPVFYGRNTFHFDEDKWLKHFSETQNPAMICHLRHVEILCPLWSLAGVANYLCKAKHLETLVMRVTFVDNPLQRANELKPLAKTIYCSQKQKDKQEVLAVFRFVDQEQESCYWPVARAEPEEAKRFETAVRGHLSEMLPDTKTMLVKLKMKSQKLEAFWQVQNLVNEYPGIRKALARKRKQRK